MAKLIEITDQHLIDIHPRLKEYVQGPFPYLRMTVAGYKRLGPTNSLVDKNGTCHGVGGVAKIHDGVWHAWMMLTPEISNHKLLFVRAMKKYIDMMDEYNIHRISADIPAWYIEWLDVLDRIGFENEGLQRAFSSNKQDYFRVAYIRK